MKLFVVSDVHGFYTEMKRALDEAGFDPQNENHWLISCGDNFDRGPDNEKVLEYLWSLPRTVLVRGNHEDLLEECCKREVAFLHDHHNGTYDTIHELGGNDSVFAECCRRTTARIGLFLDSMVDYFETKNYVFAHGYLPIRKDWRNASDYEWGRARWLNGMSEVTRKSRRIDKCVVVGHWHTSWGRSMSEGKSEFGEGADFSPYYHGDYLIAIDACTAYSRRVNCLVLEDEFI